MTLIVRPSIARHFMDGVAVSTEGLVARLNAHDAGVRLYALRGTVINTAGAIQSRVVVSSGRIFFVGQFQTIVETEFQVADNTTTYIWFDSNGVASSSAWPAYYHYRIGLVTTSGGAITALRDHRGLSYGTQQLVTFPVFAGTPIAGATSARVIARGGRLLGWRLGAQTAPGAGGITFELKDNGGTTVFTDTADRPTIASGQTLGGSFVQTWVGTQPVLGPGRYYLEVVSNNGAANIHPTLELRA